MNRDFLDMIRERFEYMRTSVVHVLNLSGTLRPHGEASLK